LGHIQKIIYKYGILEFMENINGLELSPKKSEYLKYIYERGCVVRTTDISEHFKLDPSTITKTIQDMSTELVEYTPYRGISLTPRGTEYAEFLIRRHRVIELMLSHYGLTGQEACDEALKFEGYISKDVVDKICHSLGHPSMGICGKIKHDNCCCCTEVN
jgi:DtxR family transcriptional regulator, Mn-dependent transcriptional regulator